MLVKIIYSCHAFLPTAGVLSCERKIKKVFLFDGLHYDFPKISALGILVFP